VQISFSILGPLTAELRTAELDADPIELDAGPFKQRLLLAILLCRCNDIVLTEQLIDILWWDGPPRTAHKNVQVYISHLRKLLEADGQQGRLRYRPPGYQLLLAPSEVDALRFEEQARAGRQALRRGDPLGAAAAIRQALDLWRGPALADLLVSPGLRAEAARLDDRRVAVYEDWFEAELLIGNHAEVLAEIEAVVGVHPLRERLRSQQLTALYRVGRQAEALAEYDNLRQQLASELGLSPSPALQGLYQSILSGHPALNAPSPQPPARPQRPQPDAEVVAHIAAPPHPAAGEPGPHPEPAPGAAAAARHCGLPRAVDDFTGRQDVVGDVLDLFGPGTGAATAHLRRFAAITGPPGAGTTTLALHVAHALAPRFRDGPILLRLRDDAGAPRSADELVDDLLSRLEPVPEQAPRAVRDRSTLLRSRLADLELLLILDGVADEGQVRPLLPGAGDCSVILTSCRHLGGLEGFSHFPLGVFAEDEALELLRRIIGDERVAESPTAARRIVHACGLLPLAVRIAGARLAGLVHLPLERFADRLADEGRLLDELAIGDLSVRDRFGRYVQSLDAAERLALVQVAAAWGPPSKGAGEMEQLLDRLAGVHALTVTDWAVRPAVNPLPFVMPAPLWVYAQQLLSVATTDARP
jgi:DNA-binding SARP family transcriptional activator